MEPQDRLPKHWSPLSKLPLLLDKTYLGNKTANTTRSNSELKTQGKLDPMLGLKFLFSRKFGSLHHNSESRPGYWKELFTRPASAFDVSALGWLGEAHLLGRDLVFPAPHVDLLVRVDAGDDEEHARAARPACG